MLPPGWAAFSNPVSGYKPEGSKSGGIFYWNGQVHTSPPNDNDDDDAPSWRDRERAAYASQPTQVEAQEAPFSGSPPDSIDDGFQSVQGNAVADSPSVPKVRASDVQPKSRSTAPMRRQADNDRSQSESATLSPDGFPNSTSLNSPPPPSAMPAPDVQVGVPNQEVDIAAGDVADSTSPPTREQAVSDLQNAAADPSPENDGFAD